MLSSIGSIVLRPFSDHLLYYCAKNNLWTSKDIWCHVSACMPSQPVIIVLNLNHVSNQCFLWKLGAISVGFCEIFHSGGFWKLNCNCDGLVVLCHLHHFHATIDNWVGDKVNNLGVSLLWSLLVWFMEKNVLSLSRLWT